MARNVTRELSAVRRTIPLIRPSVGEEELEEVRSVLESGWLAQGPKVKEFERRLSALLGAKYAVATSSCTTALSLSIESLDLKPGEIIVPDFTFPATGNVALRAGSTPVLVDVREDTYAINLGGVKRAMSAKTRAIIPVHPFGHPFQMDELCELAEKHGVEVIEDAATAVGTKYKGRTIGSSGRAVCLSFHPRKLLTTAEGGCLLTDDKEVYEKATAMRSHGQVSDRGKVKFIYNGLNYRMSDVHAAIGLAQLRKIGSIISSRRRQAKIYSELLASANLDVQVPIEKKWGYHTYQSYVIVLGKRLRNDRVIRLMREKFGVETQVGTYALSVQPAFQQTASRSGALKTSRELLARSLTLPLFESLTQEEQAYIVDSLSTVVRRESA
jgi:perosamine synthetase